MGTSYCLWLGSPALLNLLNARLRNCTHHLDSIQPHSGFFLCLRIGKTYGRMDEEASSSNHVYNASGADSPTSTELGHFQTYLSIIRSLAQMIYSIFQRN